MLSTIKRFKLIKFMVQVVATILVFMLFDYLVKSTPITPETVTHNIFLAISNVIALDWWRMNSTSGKGCFFARADKEDCA